MSWIVIQLDYKYIYFIMFCFGKYIVYKVYLSMYGFEVISDSELINDGLCVY